MKCTKSLAACLTTMLVCGNLAAQDTGFDLSSQRSEKQYVTAIPGKKIDHKGIVINPTPQVMDITQKDMLVSFQRGFNVKDKKGKFAHALEFLKTAKDGIKLTIDINAKKAEKNGVKPVSGAYTLTIDADQINITGYDERGAFYGIQTLRQLMLNPDGTEKKGLPVLKITDWPDLPNRGVVEGFYGTPWSHQVRLSLIDFWGKNKMNTYLYGPKDDPYHSSPNWRLPYPEDEAQQISELIEACKRNYVDFVWAIHPGKDIKWNEEDYNNLVHKFNLMYDLGVRSFAIFFDDIEGEGTNPVKQTELLNRLTKEFVEAKGDVESLTMCPTDYSRLWANPTERGSLAIFGRTLDPSIKIFYTGDVVCSDLTKETMDWLNSRIKRPGYYWWNYPVTDYARQYVLQGPTYGLDTSLTEKDLCGLVSNPMEYGEASKLALYGVADYAWNIKAYNPMDNWERGMENLMPKAKEAYRTFAIHSGDTETGYRRDESWETTTFKLSDWNNAEAQELWNEFDRVEKAPAAIEQGCANAELLKELKPWLDEFNKLGTRGKRAIELGRIYREGKDDAKFWNQYVQNLMTPEGRAAYEAHKSGTMKLQPFYDNIMDDMGEGFLIKMVGYKPQMYKGVGSFRNAGTTLTKLMFDNDSTTFYTSGISQKKNDWIGVDLGSVMDVKEINILQGRNSVDDVDYFDHVALQYSADGQNWTTLMDDMQKQYIINWKGEPVQARYVRLYRLDSKKQNYAAVRTFDVNPLRLDNIGFAIEAADAQKALYAFDKRLATTYTNEGTLSFEVVPGTKSYTLLMGQPTANGVSVTMLDKNGQKVGGAILSTPFEQLEVPKNAAKIQLNGTVEIFEIIAK